MNKYHATKTIFDGQKFDSCREANRYAELLLLQRAGLISDLKRQEEFILIPKCGIERAAKYHADFSYTDTATGKKVVEDVKSRATKTKDYILRRKLMNWRFDIQVQEV